MGWFKKTPEEIFEEQMRVTECCARIENGQVVMSQKYFMEMLVRPAFGDSDSHYEKLGSVLDTLEERNLSNSSSAKAESFNKDLTAMQQVASPKSASQTSLNPDIIKRNFGFCSKAMRN